LPGCVCVCVCVLRQRVEARSFSSVAIGAGKCTVKR